MDEAAPIFKSVFRANPNWAELVKRLPAAGLLKDDPELMQQILALVSHGENGITI